MLVRLAQLPQALTMTAYLRDQAAALYPTVTATGRDDKAWAKRFLWREANGDKDLMAIQISFARQALGVVPEPK